jgi:cytochrome c oxidase subunit II
MSAAPSSLDPAGPGAQDIATLWWILLAGGTAVFVLVVVLFVVPLLRRRRDEGADRDDVPAGKATRWIVWLGIVLPTVVLTGVLVVTVLTMRSVSRAAPEGSVQIEVTGYQFWWSANYPEHGVTVANELHIPVGEPVELRLTSADVIHSLWVPELHGKLDLLPETINTLVLEADEAGIYGGECAEFCGLQHANMGFLVVAQPRDEFDAWLAAQGGPAAAPTSGQAERGEQVFLEADCGSCHTIRGVSEAGEPGPDLTHVASRRTLASDTLDNTTANLERWLRDPEAVKVGTTMPTPDLTAEQLAALVAYLEGLE